MSKKYDIKNIVYELNNDDKQLLFDCDRKIIYKHKNIYVTYYGSKNPFSLNIYIDMGDYYLDGKLNILNNYFMSIKDFKDSLNMINNINEEKYNYSIFEKIMYGEIIKFNININGKEYTIPINISITNYKKIKLYLLTELYNTCIYEYCKYDYVNENTLLLKICDEEYELPLNICFYDSDTD